MRDVSRGIVNSIESGKNGECYLLAGDNLSFLEFFKIVNTFTKKRCSYIVIPKTMLKISGMIAEFIQTAGIPTALNNANASILCERTFLSNKKATNHLKFSARPIHQCISDYLKWKYENPFPDRP